MYLACIFVLRNVYRITKIMIVDTSKKAMCAYNVLPNNDWTFITETIHFFSLQIHVAALLILPKTSGSYSTFCATKCVHFISPHLKNHL